MPINTRKCLQYKDTWAAPGSELHEALTVGDQAKAKAIYARCERENKELLERYRGKQRV